MERNSKQVISFWLIIVLTVLVITGISGCLGSDDTSSKDKIGGKIFAKETPHPESFSIVPSEINLDNLNYDAIYKDKYKVVEIAVAALGQNRADVFEKLVSPDFKGSNHDINRFVGGKYYEWDRDTGVKRPIAIREAATEKDAFFVEAARATDEIKLSNYNGMWLIDDV